MSLKRPVFLIGFMGSGKTTIGRMLSAATALPFIDLDEQIEHEQGMSVTSLFDVVGEARFREIEHLALLDCAKRESCFISTGGGTPCYFDNMELMKKYGLTIYLKTSPHELAARLSTVTEKRPLLRGIESDQLPPYIESLLSKREPFYHLADVEVETDGLSDEAVVQLCLDRIHASNR